MMLDSAVSLHRDAATERHGAHSSAAGTAWNPNPPSAELYDPATGLFTATGPLVVDRMDHVAARLRTGRC
jgi:hypothetical protein